MPPNLEQSIPIPKNAPANNPDVRIIKLYNSAMEQKNIAPLKLLISEWTESRTFTLKYGALFVAMLPWTVTIPTATRTKRMLKNIMSKKKDLKIRPQLMSPGILPGFIAMSAALMTERLMKNFIEKPIIFDEKDCPLCIQLRGGSLQCVTGVFVPYVITVSALTFSTYEQPKKLIKKLKESRRVEWKTLARIMNDIRKVGWKNRSIVGYSMVAQFALNMFFVSKFQSEWFTMQNIIYKKSAIMNSASFSDKFS